MADKIPEGVKKLVVARLQRMPPSYALAFGGGRLYTRDDLIDSVNHETKLGERIVHIQLNYLRSFRKKVEAHE